MEDNNKKLIDAFEQIPALVKAAETYKETSNRIVTTLADAIKKRPQAEFTNDELQKLAKVISNTRCASPDMAYISRELARRVSDDIAAIIGNNIKTKASEALKGMSVTVEHSHVIERNLKEVVDKRMKNKVLILWIVIAVLLEVISISAVNYYCSDTYWGKQFNQLYSSEYLTPEEKARIEKEAGYTGILPYGYHNDPIAAQERLMMNMKELKRREKQAKKNKGRFKTEEEIHF